MGWREKRKEKISLWCEGSVWLDLDIRATHLASTPSSSSPSSSSSSSASAQSEQNQDLTKTTKLLKETTLGIAPPTQHSAPVLTKSELHIIVWHCQTESPPPSNQQNIVTSDWVKLLMIRHSSSFESRLINGNITIRIIRMIKEEAGDNQDDDKEAGCI